MKSSAKFVPRLFTSEKESSEDIEKRNKETDKRHYRAVNKSKNIKNYYRSGAKSE